jgi:hypothetical protein
VPVRRDHEVAVTAGVSLTGDETNEIAAAFPPAIRHKSVVALLREACMSPTRRRLQTVALLWSRLRFRLCVIRTRRALEPAPFEQWFDVGIAPDEILK